VGTVFRTGIANGHREIMELFFLELKLPDEVLWGCKNYRN
jgi:hypothetical protein